MPAPAAHRSAPLRENTPTHADLLDAIEEVGRKAENATAEARAAKDQTILHADELGRLRKAMSELAVAVGEEGQDERGEPIGLGIRGRVMRLEEKVRARFRFYDDVRNFAVGFAAALTAAAGVIWWLLGDKLALLLKAAPALPPHP